MTTVLKLCSKFHGLFDSRLKNAERLLCDLCNMPNLVVNGGLQALDDRLGAMQGSRRRERRAERPRQLIMC